MKNILAALLALISLAACNTASNSNIQQISEATERILTRYPQATLQDIYKSFFQDYFGVAHMLADSATVHKYIAHELSLAKQLDTAYYEPCGYRANFYRVNLSAIRDGKISVEELTAAFTASQPYSRTQIDDRWLSEWKMIQCHVRESYPHLKDFDKDSATIADNLNNGRYVMHHSEVYGTEYHPHYRIVHKSIFEKRLLPKLRSCLKLSP